MHLHYHLLAAVMVLLSFCNFIVAEPIPSPGLDRQACCTPGCGSCTRRYCDNQGCIWVPYNTCCAVWVRGPPAGKEDDGSLEAFNAKGELVNWVTPIEQD